GSSTPDWFLPWNAYDDAAPAELLTVAASALAPPVRTRPASAVPAAPVAVPLMNLRRLRSTGSSPRVAVSSGLLDVFWSVPDICSMNLWPCCFRTFLRFFPNHVVLFLCPFSPWVFSNGVLPCPTRDDDEFPRFYTHFKATQSPRSLAVFPPPAAPAVR